MPAWILRTPARRGRCSFLADSTSAMQLDWTGDAGSARRFCTRADAIAYRDSELVPTFGRYVRRLVPHNTAPKPRAMRGVVQPTQAEYNAVHDAVRTASERARAVALDLPEFAVIFTEGRRCCLGGRGRDGRYFITIDRWVLRDTRVGYLTYTVAHEMAHVADVFHHRRTDHGPLFMAHLKMLCPPEFQAYELAYKPTMARAAGIRLSDAAAEVAANVRERLRPRIR